MFLKNLTNDFRSNFFKNIIVIVTLSIVMFFSLALYILNENINNFIFDYTWVSSWIENPNLVEVRTSQSVFTTENWTWDADIKSLTWDELIDEIYYFYTLSIPNTFYINLFWTELKSDFLLYSASDELFSSFDKEWELIPMWISQRILDIYNLELARSPLFPSLSKQQLSFLNFDIKFNHSSIFNIDDNYIEKSWKIEVVDDYFPMLWVTIPYSLSKEITQELWVSQPQVNRALVFLESEDYIDKFEDRYSDLDTQSAIWQLEDVYNRLFVIRAFFFTIFSFIVVLLFSFLFFVIHSIIYDNKKMLEVFRSHWASKLKIFNIIYFKILYYFLLASFIFYILVYIFNKFFLYIFNNYVYSNYQLEIWFVWASYYTVLFFSLLFLLMITLIVILVSKKEFSKKFIFEY